MVTMHGMFAKVKSSYLTQMFVFILLILESHVNHAHIRIIDDPQF
jgi:hypothetical protein